MIIDHKEKANALLKADAAKILKLIKVQMDNLTMPQCPLYEEVLDTQMFGLSREIDFAVRLGLIEEAEGKAILDELERELSMLHEASVKKIKKTQTSFKDCLSFFYNCMNFKRNEIVYPQEKKPLSCIT
ncbi:hypothetical protein HMPREF1013_00479 [Bacillus sp. 2_A_57_CT2]|nr:hypothetical protein HMPREF1013_00479 [Bacillus sp. 2_A_57_CT2]